MSEEFNNYGSPSNGSENKGMAIASMVLGIISIVCCWQTYICFGCGIVGLVLGIMFNKKNGASNGMSKAGIICSIIGMALEILLIIIGIAVLGAVGIGLSDLANYY